MSEEGLDLINDNKNLKLSDFPKKLRQVAVAYIESEGTKSINEVCQELKLSYNTVKKYIQTYRQKGKDFWELCGTLSYENLKANIPRIDKAIVEKAVEGSAKHAEISYKRAGLLNETFQHEHKHIHLHHSAPLPAIAVHDLEDD
jgi:predicted transcriptional regulator